MKRSVFAAVTAALATAGFPGAGGSGQGADPPTGASPSNSGDLQEVLAHAVPPGRSATYDVVDTILMSIGSPLGVTELTAVAATTLSVSFGGDGDGVRVNAEVVDFAGSTGNPAIGTRSLGSGDARGSMIFVVGPTGAVEQVERPVLSADAGQFSLFNQLPYDLFPGLPGRVVGPAESWSDTVVWNSSVGGMETTSTMARTYTLAGNTEQDGRSLLVITLSAEVAISNSGSQGGRSSGTTITGSLAGHLLWDPEAGLLHTAELMRRYEGRSTMQGRAPGTLTFAGPQRIARKD